MQIHWQDAKINPQIKIELPIELFAPAESLHYEGTFDLPVLKAGPDLYSFTKPIEYRVDISNTGDAFLVTGEALGTGLTGCARCLNDAVIDFVGEIEGYYVINPAEIPEEEREDDFDILPEDKTLVLDDLIIGALLLDAPTIPLCSDDCRGLCPICGINLNTDTCSCGNEPDELNSAESPFAALKDYKFD